MTAYDIIIAAISVTEDMRGEFVPIDTGNMAYNALSYDSTEEEFIIRVDPAIAPYVPYTNEPWLSEKWNGKQNPNEGWWQRFVEKFMKRFAEALGGEVEDKQ